MGRAHHGGRHLGRIPQNFIDELIARADIVEVIGARVQLKKAGREYKACCPFHNEKTPSFWVSPDKQFYHCFGCGKHGTVLGFLMEHDRMAFPEAVEELATRLGLQVPHEGGVDASARRADEPLFELMARVARFYAEALAREARARDYLAQRGLAPEIIARFGLGYAPNSWNEVLRRFGAAEPERQRLADAGLIVEREGQMRDGERHYDRFRDRIMFPIRDARGRVIAFGGRIIDTGEPKYLNSPETVLFHKGRELYGIYETRRARANLTRLVVVEGYMDVVRLHQSGVDYALATLGTATTPEHLRRIFRLVPAVVFAFDGDRAGRAAAWRALQQALPEAREGREMRFLFLPEGQDPDTLVGAEGGAAFEQRLQGAVPLSEYLVRELSEQSELAHADGRARFAESARPLFERVPEGVYRELLLERLAAVVGLPAQRLQELWSSARKPPAAAATPPPPLRRRSARAATGAGRGSLVRQAIVRLLHYPAIAGEVSLAERAGLDASEEAGVGLLRELLDNLREQPAQISAQVIQRWSGREGGEALQKLLEREEVITDAAAAAGELRGALVKLADLAAGRRLEALETKSRTGSLAQHELEEFQRLIKKMGH